MENENLKLLEVNHSSSQQLQAFDNRKSAINIRFIHDKYAAFGCWKSNKSSFPYVCRWLVSFFLCQFFSLFFHSFTLTLLQRLQFFSITDICSMRYFSIEWTEISVNIYISFSLSFDFDWFASSSYHFRITNIKSKTFIWSRFTTTIFFFSKC